MNQSKNSHAPFVHLVKYGERIPTNRQLSCTNISGSPQKVKIINLVDGFFYSLSQSASCYVAKFFGCVPEQVR